MPPKRLSLVERQQKLLEERGFSKPKETPVKTAMNGPVGRRPSKSGNFMQRQEAHLLATGRANASGLSRKACDMPEVEYEEGSSGDEGDGGNARSVASHVSKAPSLHPSMAGTVMSQACSEVTIGAGDDTGYWDFQHRTVVPNDLGHKCRECKMPFTHIGDPLTERRGARLSIRYHAECFSGYADPRSQTNSSHFVGKLAGTQFEAAPSDKAGSKMRTGSHFDGKSSKKGEVQAVTTRGGGKISAFMGSNGFGAKSSKGKPAPAPKRGPGDLTESKLAEHMRQMELGAIDEVAEEP